MKYVNMLIFAHFLIFVKFVCGVVLTALALLQSSPIQSSEARDIVGLLTAYWFVLFVSENA